MKSSLSNDSKDWEIGSDYEFVKIIGRGSYAIVCLAIHKPSNTKVAIKKVLNIYDNLTNAKRILREINFLKGLRHPNIVRLYEVLPPNDLSHFENLYLVMEYSSSDMKKLVKSATYLQLIHIQRLIYNVLVGLKYIHSAGVLHRDIKPANILVNPDCTIRICDFGLGRSVADITSASVKKMKLHIKDSAESTTSKETIEDEKTIMEPLQLEEIKSGKRGMKRELTGHVATRWYRAPEIILLEKDYGPEVDVWSVGCIFAELLTMIKGNVSNFKERQPLFPGTSCFPLSPGHKDTKQKVTISEGDQLGVIFEIIGTPEEKDTKFIKNPTAIKYLKIFKPRSHIDLKAKFPATRDDALDLLNKMLIFNPSERITVDDCLEHPLFAGVRRKSSEKTMSNIIELPFENEKDLGEDKLKELFIKEINYYKKLRDEGKNLYD